MNNDNNGLQASIGALVYSPLIALTDGGESITDGDSSNTTDLTVDIGLWSGISLGNLVWNDANNDGQSAGETGISGLAIDLRTRGANNVAYDADDVTAATTSTNASGIYGFTVYAPGVYYIRVTPSSSYPIPSAVSVMYW